MGRPSRDVVPRAAPAVRGWRARLRTIAGLSLPIVGGMVSQNVVNLVDIAMVGAQGDAALAAVGTASFASFLAAALLIGLSSGVQAMAARRLGEGRDHETAIPLNGALLVATGFAIPWSALLFALAPTLFPYLNDDPAVVAVAVPYLQARIVAILAVAANFAFRGYWNGVNRSGLYLRTLLVMHVSNIVLNWGFIYGNLGLPELGAPGAGVASAIAMWIGTVYYFAMGVRHARAAGFLRGLPNRETTRTILRLSVPSGVQRVFFAAGHTALFWIIGKVGTTAAAAAAVLVNVTMVAILPGFGLGLAAGSLVGQALGRRNPDDASRWGWEVVGVGAVVMGLLGLPMLIAPDLVLSGFLHDPAALDLARGPLRLVGATMALDAVGMVLLNALHGAGASRQSATVTIAFQWGVFLPLAYLVGPVLGQGLLAIWVAMAAYRTLQAGTAALLWRSRAWAGIRV